MKLQNKNIVVTGGSLGIGLEIVKTAAREGANVIIVARTKKHLENALQEIKEISDGNHSIYELDISDIAEVKQFGDWCNKKYDSIDGLVNCAGIYGPIGQLSDVDLQKFHDAININFLGTVNMCHTFLPILNSTNRKKIINYSGGGAASPFANYSAYATSKVAVVRLTENLAIEYEQDGLDINCIAPGFVVTRLHEQTLNAGAKQAGEKFFENTKKTIENGGVPATKAAELTMFLLSNESDGITGKFLSAPWDPWNEESYLDEIRNNKDAATLRRIDNKYFVKKDI